jgi:hypothetical protein
VRISTPSARTIAMFSGRFTSPNEISGAVGRRRPITARSATPPAMPSGSGSGWSRIPTFSRRSSSDRTATTRRRLPSIENSSSMSSRISERSPVARKEGWGGSAPGSTASESTSTGACGTVSSTIATAARANAASSVTNANSSSAVAPSFAIARPRGRPAAR